MTWLVVEALLALVLLVFLVAWTMSGRRRGAARQADAEQQERAREPGTGGTRR